MRGKETIDRGQQTNARQQEPRQGEATVDKINFGGIPDSSSIDILMPYMPSLTTWAPFCAVVLPMWTMLSPWTKQSHGCSCQGCKATNHTGTLQNLPRPSGSNLSEPSGTNLSEPSETYLLNLRQHTPEPPKSSGTCLRNLHHFTPELSGTFRNLPPEPTPAHAGTLRNLPELSSGTCFCDPHRHTPELIWAEDPISLRCWGIKR